MARPASVTRKPITSLPELIAPREITFFRPAKGIDVVSPLSALAPEYSPLISNLVLDRGVLRSRYGVEAYHANQAGKKIQLTTDLVGSDVVADQTITARSTAGLTAAGWVDSDGGNDGINSIARSVGQPEATAANLTNDIGDPAIGNNVDAYDDLYTLKFEVTSDAASLSQPASPMITAEFSTVISVEASTNGGSSWSQIWASTITALAGQTKSVVFNPAVAVSGAPTQLRFRLRLTVRIQGGFPVASGSGSGSVKVYSTSWPTAAYPITWSTSSSSSSVPTPRVPVRWTESHLQTYDDVTEVASAWTDVYAFPASQLNTDNLLPSYVTWKNTLVSTDVGSATQAGVPARIGSKGLISTLLTLPHTTTILTHSPRAAHIAIFGNRVVASRVNEWTAGTDPWVEAPVNLTRVRWCVKDNNNDWAGLGSGFEDLYVPGSHTDEVMGCFPVSDETAIVVSERSIRRMDVTGFFDAPFRFTLLTQSLGTLSRYSIRCIPGGVIFLTADDAITFTLGSVQRIGTRALRDSLKQITSPRLAYGYYDQYNARYLVTFRESTTAVVWQYSFLDEGWTKLSFPFDVVSIDRSYFTVAGVIFFSVYLTMAATDGYSCRENCTVTTDVDATGASVDSQIEARTGLVQLDSPLRKVGLIEVQLLYQATQAQTLTFDYSTDGGATWSMYSQKAIVATARPTILSVRKTLETSGLQIRVRSPSLGGLKIISLHAFATPGAMVRA